MIRSLDDVAQDAWQEAVSRLNGVGVFGNEGRKFPEPSLLQSRASDLIRILRGHGYAGGDIGFAELDPPREGVSLLVFDSNRITDDTSAEVHWYDDYRKRWKDRVTARVADWLGRLENLKRDMADWLPEGFHIRDRPPVPMHEELMRKFHVARANMPSFDILREGTPVMRFQPKGLWTIGANGRIDLVRREGTFILVDQSENLSGNPQWEYYAPGNARATTKLNKDTFIQLLV